MRRIVVLLVFAGVVTGCAGAPPAGVSPSVAPASQPSTAASVSAPPVATSSPVATASAAGVSPSPDPDRIAGLVDIGGGRTLYLTCSGTGTPTILLESGDEGDTDSWGLVPSALENHTRACSYERAGVGRSVQASGCREIDDILGDLEALLKVAGIKGPFVLVGHSGGGFLMAAFAARHPKDVAGLVLVETPKAITILPPELKAQIACDAPNNIEKRDYATVEHAAWDHKKRIGDFPMTIISNDFGAAAPPNDDEQTNVPDQRGWLVLSPNSKQVVVTSGHEVQENEPSLVIDEILAVLEAARHR